MTKGEKGGLERRGEEPGPPGARPGPIDTLTLGNLGAAQDVRQHEEEEEKEKRKESENRGQRGCPKYEKGEHAWWWFLGDATGVARCSG